jgi:hypothetical protein
VDLAGEAPDDRRDHIILPTEHALTTGRGCPMHTGP